MRNHFHLELKKMPNKAVDSRLTLSGIFLIFYV